MSTRSRQLLPNALALTRLTGDLYFQEPFSWSGEAASPWPQPILTLPFSRVRTNYSPPPRPKISSPVVVEPP